MDVNLSEVGSDGISERLQESYFVSSDHNVNSFDSLEDDSTEDDEAIGDTSSVSFESTYDE